MKLFSIFFTLLLTACSSVSTPDSHYYRLPEVNLSDQHVINKATKNLSVSNVKVTGMLINRNLLYIEKDRANEVIQFNYHLWHESLPKILTNHFINFLKQSSENNKVTEYKYKTINGLHIQMVVRNMEIQYLPDSALLYVKVNLLVNNDKGKIVLDKSYSGSRTYKTKEIYQLVTGYDDVLKQVYSQFVTDLSRL